MVITLEHSAVIDRIFVDGRQSPVFHTPAFDAIDSFGFDFLYALDVCNLDNRSMQSWTLHLIDFL